MLNITRQFVCYMFIRDYFEILKYCTFCPLYNLTVEESSLWVGINVPGFDGSPSSTNLHPHKHWYTILSFFFKWVVHSRRKKINFIITTCHHGISCMFLFEFQVYLEYLHTAICIWYIQCCKCQTWKSLNFKFQCNIGVNICLGKVVNVLCSL